MGKIKYSCNFFETWRKLSFQKHSNVSRFWHGGNNFQSCIISGIKNIHKETNKHLTLSTFVNQVAGYWLLPLFTETTQQGSTLCTHETGRNFPLNYWGIWLLPVFGVKYIPLQCQAIVCQHTSGPLAWYHFSLAIISWWNLSPCLSLTLPRFCEKKSECVFRKWIFKLISHPIALYKVNRSCTISW